MNLTLALRQIAKNLCYCLRAWRDGVSLRSSASTPQEYWTRHTISSPTQFSTVEESLDFFYWRSYQYLGFLDLLPVVGADGKVVLDYGCGPGHDLVGFAHFSTPKRLIGMDVSPTALVLAKQRLHLHLVPVEFIQIQEATPVIPLDDASVDLIHSSGVLHHVPDTLAILREFKRILKPDGFAQVMVYNYDSLWMHLYTAYLIRIKQGRYSHLTKRQAFARLTDGEHCPIADCYHPAEFIALAQQAGLQAEFTGAAISVFEMSILPKRFEALQHRALDQESREFLYHLQMDEHGLPRWQNHVAGVDACFRLHK